MATFKEKGARGQGLKKSFVNRQRGPYRYALSGDVKKTNEYPLNITASRNGHISLISSTCIRVFVHLNPRTLDSLNPFISWPLFFHLNPGILDPLAPVCLSGSLQYPYYFLCMVNAYDAFNIILYAVNYSTI